MHISLDKWWLIMIIYCDLLWTICWKHGNIAGYDICWNFHSHFSIQQTLLSGICSQFAKNVLKTYNTKTWWFSIAMLNDQRIIYHGFLTTGHILYNNLANLSQEGGVPKQTRCPTHKWSIYSKPTLEISYLQQIITTLNHSIPVFATIWTMINHYWSPWVIQCNPICTWL